MAPWACLSAASAGPASTVQRTGTGYSPCAACSRCVMTLASGAGASPAFRRRFSMVYDALREGQVEPTAARALPTTAEPTDAIQVAGYAVYAVDSTPQPQLIHPDPSEKRPDAPSDSASSLGDTSRCSPRSTNSRPQQRNRPSVCRIVKVRPTHSPELI